MKMVLRYTILGDFFIFILIKVLLNICSVTGDVNEIMMFRNIRDGEVSESLKHSSASAACYHYECAIWSFLENQGIDFPFQCQKNANLCTFISYYNCSRFISGGFRFLFVYISFTIEIIRALIIFLNDLAFFFF